MSDEEKSQINTKDNKEYDSSDVQKTALFEFGEENNILDRSKRNLAKLSWFQRLFK